MVSGLVITIICAVVLLCLLTVLVVVVVRRRRRRVSISDDIVMRPRSRHIIDFTIPRTMPTKPLYAKVEQAKHLDAERSINPELYVDKEASRRESVPSAPSRLCFSIAYDVSSEKLTVDVIRGEMVRSRKSGVNTNPYVKVCLLPDKRKKAQTKVQKTQHPWFNEEFVFYCPASDIKTRCVKFTVCDFDRFSRQNTIGTILFSLEYHYDEVTSDEGCVEIWRDIEDFSCESVCGGEVLVSLQYLPSAKRLTVVILKGKGFEANNEGKAFGLYMKISYVIGGRTVKTRKTTKKSLEGPIFNESFHFDITVDALDRTSVQVSVVNHKQLLGRVVVGPMLYASGSGLTHWEDMLRSPRKAIAMWHVLF